MGRRCEATRPLPAVLLGAIFALAACDHHDPCKASLRSLSWCAAGMQLQMACHSMELLRNPVVQGLMGCSNYDDCENLCLDKLADVASLPNTAHNCTIQEQLMIAYSDSPELVFQTSAKDPRRQQMLPATLFGKQALPSFAFLGDFDACRRNDGMQFCIVHERFRVGSVYTNGLLGICRPSVCSEQAIHQDVVPLLASVGITDFKVNCQVDGELPPIEWSVSKGNFAILSVAIVVLVLVSSIRDLWTRPPASSAASQGPAAAFVRAWSMPRNLASFGRSRTDDAEANGVTLQVLDGLRCLSTYWVMLGHMLLWPLLSMQYASGAKLFPPEGLYAETWFQFVPAGATVAVDTFFWLSGFLSAWSLHGRALKTPKLFEPRRFLTGLYPMAVFGRWLRLTPAYAFVMLFQMSWYQDLGRGALLWNQYTSTTEDGQCSAVVVNPRCSQVWWSHFLYINNLLSKDRELNGCMFWTWYLAADMQMFLVVPFLVLLRVRYSKVAAWLLLTLLTVASVVAKVYVVAHEQLIPDPLISSFGPHHYIADGYMVTWLRASAALIGVGFAWVLEGLSAAGLGDGASPAGDLRAYEANAGARGCGGAALLRRCQAARRTLAAAVSVPWLRTVGALSLQALSFALMLFVVFAPVSRVQCAKLTDCLSVETQSWSQMENALYGGTMHALWALGLGVLMLLCFLRAPGVWWMNTLLGAQFWQTLAKLTLLAYLLHPLVATYLLCQKEGFINYTNAELFGLWACVSSVAFAGAFLVWLLVEKPLANLSAQLLGALMGKGGKGGKGNKEVADDKSQPTTANP